MAVSRQQSLFAAENWQAAYKAFSQIDYQAYDFDTMRSAMVDYVRTNFPENFNDYIESSEFIAIIELLAYLSQSLAFRMDMNTRENFLETAERRESVFKLARMLGYTPRRNVPASGLMKIVSVKTSEPLQDSLGNELNNRVVYWDDANNTNSYEQFITVMNAAMSRANRFTAPTKTGQINGINTELYQLNSPVGSPIAYNFNLNVNGTTRAFNAVNPDFVDNSHFFERHPDPTNLFNMIYMNDGKGVASKNTGFFVMFRQGVLQYRDFNYTTPVENRQEDIEIANINETDVFLQEVDTTGIILNEWEKIPNTVGQTLNYNSKSLNTRNLYAVDTIGDTGIRLRFADGNFGNIPIGIHRLWYRVSDPTRYTIQPEDARNISINIPYLNAQGREYTLTVRFSLQYAVNNSLPAESIESIKERAPAVYYTQNRMVSAQDYNVFPQSQSNNITKIKALNRTHSGHSRYIDINDPTGTYHNVDTFADDSYLYLDDTLKTETITINNTTTPLEVITSIIANRLKEQEINNFAYMGIRELYTNPLYGGNLETFKYTIADTIEWNPLPIEQESDTGYITERFSTGDRNILVNNTVETKRLTNNTFMKFVNPDNYAEFKWVRVLSVTNNGTLTSGINNGIGPWTLSASVKAGWRLTDTIVTLRKTFSEYEIYQLENYITSKKTFGIGYDLITDDWYLIPSEELNRTGDFSIDSTNRGPNSWLILMEYSASRIGLTGITDSYTYNMSIRGQQYVVQSEADLKFYNVDHVKTLGSNNRSDRDSIMFPTTNTQPGEFETYAWSGKTWDSVELGTSYLPSGVTVRLPLKTRSTTWEDIDTSWVSNFGILEPVAGNPQDLAINNRYVSDAVIGLNTYTMTTASTNESNVVVQPNTGQILYLPDTITFEFNEKTFNQNIVTQVDGKYSIVYRQRPTRNVQMPQEIIVASVGEQPVAYGTDGSGITNRTGNLYLDAYDETTGIGTLRYINIQDSTLHNSADGTGVVHKDKLRIYYKVNKEQLLTSVNWDVAGVYRESDGYTDPRKIKVSPIDVDNDGVPDYPAQFNEYVGPNDFVYFEYYNDIDGYRYDRPVTGAIVDIRDATSLTVNGPEGWFAHTTNQAKKYFFADTDWVVLGTSELAPLLNVTQAAGLVIYCIQENVTYQVTPVSTSFGDEVSLVETTDYFVKRGRGKTQNTLLVDQQPGTVRWKHVAPNDVRIDPSISNVVEMIVLTTGYYARVQQWLSNTGLEFPKQPTSNELAREFSALNMYKSASDSLVYRSAKFKLLFGSEADTEYQARFRVVKLNNQYSDNELKTRIIKAINSYFAVANWEFGETFYFTELSSYIHQELGSAIGSIVILPKSNTGKFGEMFQVKADPNELFISAATVSDIEIIGRLDNQTLRTDR